MIDNPKQAQIIHSPYRLIPSKELHKYNDETVCLQLRLYGVELIRLFRTGGLTAESVEESICGFNELLRDFGKPELPLDFLDEAIQSPLPR